MLMRTDPFRELDRIAQQAFGLMGTSARPTVMPLDAYRHGDEFVVEFDLPGVDPAAIDLTVQHNVLTVRAERRPTPIDEHTELQVSERSHGVFSRELFLGEALDLDKLTAEYDAGVLTLRIPVAETAKPRTISIASAAEQRREINA
jgi:HSP20 family protein